MFLGMLLRRDRRGVFKDSEKAGHKIKGPWALARLSDSLFDISSHHIFSARRAGILHGILPLQDDGVFLGQLSSHKDRASRVILVNSRRICDRASDPYQKKDVLLAHLPVWRVRKRLRQGEPL